MIDTNVAIHLRDGDPAITQRLAALGSRLAISIVTLVELEAGTASSSDPLRRKLLDRMLKSIAVLPFAEVEAAAYGTIVKAVGHDRRRVLDHMIAAQAIVARMTLVTFNAADFRRIPGLELEAWKL